MAPEFCWVHTTSSDIFAPKGDPSGVGEAGTGAVRCCYSFFTLMLYCLLGVLFPARDGQDSVPAIVWMIKSI